MVLDQRIIGPSTALIWLGTSPSWASPTPKHQHYQFYPSATSLVYINDIKLFCVYSDQLRFAVTVRLRVY
jgi:hypothetical protein